MFSTSVRRAASTPQISSFPCLVSIAPRATSSQALSYRSHQRRFSSSKPSSPADGSKGVARGPEVSAKPTSPVDNTKSVVQGQEVSADAPQVRPDSEKKSPRTPKRKGKSEALFNLPSVPSTQHIPPGQITASSFFSLHRPISLHISFPKNVTDDAFAAIFTPRTRANAKPSEVISTLSATLETLEVATGYVKGSQQEQWNTETDELRAAITAESYRTQDAQHLDSAPGDSAMSFTRQIMSGKYQPFSPPPAPMPMNTAESLAAGAEAAELENPEPQHRTYTAVLTIEESTDSNGDVTYMAHSSPLIQKDPPVVPARFLERMSIRQERSRERAEKERMEAISVKRQRKLKMKKHKYKKLMRRTRNLRRRLDRN